MEFIAHPYPRCGRLATQELPAYRIVSLANIYAARALIALGRYPVSDLHGCTSILFRPSMISAVTMPTSSPAQNVTIPVSVVMLHHPGGVV